VRTHRNDRAFAEGKILARLESCVILSLPWRIRERIAMADFNLGYFGDRRLQKRGGLR
jgi:hypothetical protein